MCLVPPLKNKEKVIPKLVWNDLFFGRGALIGFFRKPA